MNSFDALLGQYTESLITERVAPMTLKQRQKVASMKRSGWTIKDRDDDKTIMVKGDKHVFVYPTGKTFFITETEEVDTTFLTDSLLQEDDLLMEALVDDTIKKLKRIVKNPTIITMQRGNMGFIVAMGDANEYTRIENGELVDAGTLTNRKAARDLLFRLEQSGFRETKFQAVVPRFITKIKSVVTKQAPVIAVMLIIYAMLPPPVSSFVNMILKGAWSLLSTTLMSLLPIESMQSIASQVDGVLSNISFGASTSVDAAWSALSIPVPESDVFVG